MRRFTVICALFVSVLAIHSTSINPDSSTVSAGTTAGIEPTALPPSPLLPPLLAAPPAASPEHDPDTYRADRVMVRPTTGVLLDDLARALGTTVAREVGPAGVGALATPEGMDALVFADLLAATPGVASAAREARFYGASIPAGASWHMDVIDRPAPGTALSDWVVAVLDTGVAYEAYTSGGTFYKQASGFADVTVVSPADFVNSDAHANDDHQHGTHIASIILSQGAIPGVASGAALMPVKVLDANNGGNELDLIDGIDHAVANGADVINMSLAFPLGYVASVELQQALFDAHDAGVVMVAAAGNDGADELAWPAASPLTIAVGSVRSDATGPDDLAAYSNRGPGLDVVAPGGSLALDVNQDGYGDGVAAQTIDLHTPGSTSFVMYQGTSQATAMVSGAVVHLLDDGVAPADIRARLQGSFSATGATSDGSGGDVLSVTDVRSHTGSDQDLAVGGMSFVKRYQVSGAMSIEPTLRVVAVDDSGDLVTSGTVLVQVDDESGVSWRSCALDSDGTCDVVVGTYVDTTSAPSAWTYSVVGVVAGGTAHRPSRAIFTSDSTEIVMAAIDDAAIDSDRAIALYWPAGTDAELGQLAEAFSVTSTGAELADAPVVGSFLRRHVSPLIDSETTIDLAIGTIGSGILGEPSGGWGVLAARELDLDGGGTGLLGSRTTKLLAVDGSSQATTAFGWHGTHLFAHHGGVIAPADLDLGLNGLAVRLDGPATGAVAGSFLGDWVDGGGDVASDGYEAGRALLASGTLDIGHLLAAAATSGSGEQSEWLCEDVD